MAAELPDCFKAYDIRGQIPSQLNEEVVYRIVKEVFENLDLFKRQHPAFAKLTPERLSTKLIVPLHPGAERYF